MKKLTREKRLNLFLRSKFRWLNQHMSQNDFKMFVRVNTPEGTEEVTWLRLHDRRLVIGAHLITQFSMGYRVVAGNLMSKEVRYIVRVKESNLSPEERKVWDVMTTAVRLILNKDKNPASIDEMDSFIKLVIEEEDRQ